MLVGIMVAALAIPLFRLTTEKPTIINDGLHRMEQDFTTAVISTQKITVPEERLNWVDYAIMTYSIGVLVMLCLTAAECVELVRYLRGGLRHTDGHGNTIILKTGNVAPFSILKYIVMSVNDYETNRTYILTHEQEHIRLGHTYDILLLEAMKIMQWFNPFIWLLGRDLKAVHEFEADRAVINQGIDAKAYQTLLVTKAVGERLQPLINNLNHNSLKRRITMMYHKKSSQWMMLKALCAIPVAALAITAFAKPTTIEKMENAITKAEGKVTRTVKRTVEEKLAPESTKGNRNTAVKSETPTLRKTGPTEVTEEERPTSTPKDIPVYNDMPKYTGNSKTERGVRIRRTKECTYVTLICTSHDDTEKYKIGGRENRTFIEDVETGDHYKARRVKDGAAVFGGDGFIVSGMKGKRWAVTLEFPPIPESVERITFWHLDNWTDTQYKVINIKDIEEI